MISMHYEDEGRGQCVRRKVHNPSNRSESTNEWTNNTYKLYINLFEKYHKNKNGTKLLLIRFVSLVKKIKNDLIFLSGGFSYYRLPEPPSAIYPSVVHLLFKYISQMTTNSRFYVCPTPLKYNNTCMVLYGHFYLVWPGSVRFESISELKRPYKKVNHTAVDH